MWCLFDLFDLFIDNPPLVLICIVAYALFRAFIIPKINDYFFPNPLVKAILEKKDVSGLLTKENIEYKDWSGKSALIYAIENDVFGEQYQMLLDATKKFTPKVLDANNYMDDVKSAFEFVKKNEHIIRLLETLDDEASIGDYYFKFMTFSNDYIKIAETKKYM